MGYQQTNDIVLDALADRIRALEKERDKESMETFMLFCFLTNERRDLIPEWVRFVYEFDARDQERALSRDWRKEMVAAFHDEALDLSTLECAKKDFEPWEGS